MTAVVACTLGGLTVIAISVPRYQGSAKVVLDYIRPDPTTGSVLPSKMLDAYIASQIKLIRDIQVTGPAVEALGWLDSPDFQESYAARDPRDTRDIQTWLGNQLGASAGAQMVEGSNIMEIRYVGQSPGLAEAVVEALRSSYIQADVSAKRNAAAAAADSLTSRLTIEYAALLELERLQNRSEDETGLTMGDAGLDEESARLEQLLRQDAPGVIVESGLSTPTEVRLRQIDAEIAQASAGLGANNPVLSQMRQRRIVLQAQVDAKQSRRNASITMSEMSQRTLADMIEKQKTKVLAVREPTLRLRLMQDEINQKRKTIEMMNERLLRSREISVAITSQVSPVGLAESSPKPVFPNKLLILGGSGGLGLLLGCLLAFLAELMGRRVRAATDLESATDVPVLAAIPDVIRRAKARGRTSRNPNPGTFAFSPE